MYGWLSIAFGFLAAALWFVSATIRLPSKITVGWGGVGGSAQELADRLKQQGWWSALAAAATGLSVLFQALSQLV